MNRVRLHVEQEFRKESPPLTISVGMAQFPDGVTHADELIREADKALYEAKRAGKNRIHPA